MSSSHHALLWNHNILPSPDQEAEKKTQGFLFIVDTLNATHTESDSEVRKTQTVGESVLHSGNSERAGLSSALRLMLDRETLCCTMAVDKAAVWPASVLTALAAFKETPASPLFFFCGGGSLSAVSFTLSRLPSGFLWFLQKRAVWITAPQHVHRPERPSCCLLHLWSSAATWQVQAAVALNKYHLRGSRGVQAETGLRKHFHIEKYMIVYLEEKKKTLPLPIVSLQVKKLGELSQHAFHFHVCGEDSQAGGPESSSWYLRRFTCTQWFDCGQMFPAACADLFWSQCISDEVGLNIRIILITMMEMKQLVCRN